MVALSCCQNFLNFIVKRFGVERLDQIMLDTLFLRILNFSFIIFYSNHDEGSQTENPIPRVTITIIKYFSAGEKPINGLT